MKASPCSAFFSCTLLFVCLEATFSDFFIGIPLENVIVLYLVGLIGNFIVVISNC